MNKIIGVMVIALFITGCGLPTAVVKTAMTKDISVCDSIVVGTTTREQVEKILKEKPVYVKLMPTHIEDYSVAVYKSGYFKASVTYNRDNVVSYYECSKE